MGSIYWKEIKYFFSSTMGYLVIGFFLLISGLMLWVFPETSILEYPYASLDPYFNLAPTILMILIPAITMRSIAEEKQNGTLELLFSKPISSNKIIREKYLANLSLVCMAILPTLVYLLSIRHLVVNVNMLDFGEILAGYLALIFLAATFTAFGLFSSAISENQIVAFIVGVFLCFIGYYGFFYISELPFFFGGIDFIIQQIGIDYHFESMSRGVIELKDVVYFTTIILGCLWLTNRIIRS